MIAAHTCAIVNVTKTMCDPLECQLVGAVKVRDRANFVCVPGGGTQNNLDLSRANLLVIPIDDICAKNSFPT